MTIINILLQITKKMFSLFERNIFLDRHVKTKIGDFGISRTFDYDTPTPYMGTIGYQSPEMIKGINYRYKTDIW